MSGLSFERGIDTGAASQDLRATDRFIQKFQAGATALHHAAYGALDDIGSPLAPKSPMVSQLVAGSKSTRRAVASKKGQYAQGAGHPVNGEGCCSDKQQRKHKGQVRGCT